MSCHVMSCLTTVNDIQRYNDLVPHISGSHSAKEAYMFKHYNH